jgi:hypothetical protein
MLRAMELSRLILGLIGLSLILRFSEGPFAGSAEDEARRRLFRRIGVGLVFVGLILGTWNEYD